LWIIVYKLVVELYVVAAWLVNNTF
jgi:hypothetical protein